MKNLIIVESPSKSKTIESYMGENYKVMSSLGHIRDLATTGKDGLGIDIENDFKPNYQIIKGKAQLVKELKQAAKNSHVFLATDPDREGEAISFHLKEVLNLSDNDYERIEFHEITKPAIKEAFLHPRKINYDLVKSQETRRMLDRIIGFKVSKLLQSKIKSKSAGRVQSVALKLICDLEEEIKAFISTPYYELKAIFDEFNADLVSYKGNKDRILSRDLADEIKESLNPNFIIKSIEFKDFKRESKPAYTTSTLQQDASNKLNFQSSRTMRIAQALYEGKKIGDEHVGLITYMRTDSTRLADIFVSEASEYIKNQYGINYLGHTHIKTQKLAQDAHEAIRPTSINRTPEMMKRYLTPEEYNLYKLIYNRTITSLMSPAEFKKETVLLNNNETIWKATGQTLVFDGYLKAYGIDEDDRNKYLPNFNENEALKAKDVEVEELFTKPKQRFTEASLIKEMEELGIGRPSTYATTMSVLKEREYITVEKKFLIPTEQGLITSKVLNEYFYQIFNVKYTANMETMLDKISKGEYDYKQELRDFYNEFLPIYENAWKNMEKAQPVLTDELCPLCGSPLAVRKSKYGEFLACSNYPNCKYIKAEENPNDNVDTGIICPKCGEGHIMQKVARTGRNKGNLFFACSNYLKCKNIYSDRPTNEKCPNCGQIMLINSEGKLYCSAHCDSNPNIICPVCGKGHIVKRVAKRGKTVGNEFYACDQFPRCKALFVDVPTGGYCEICNSPLLKNKDGIIYCSNNECPNNKIR